MRKQRLRSVWKRKFKPQTNELLASMKINQSMSRKGNCWDNAVTESFFATLKVELVNRYTYQTTAIAKADITNYIDNWYNKERLHST
jgi:putative transposase